MGYHCRFMVDIYQGPYILLMSACRGVGGEGCRGLNIPSKPQKGPKRVMRVSYTFPDLHSKPTSWSMTVLEPQTSTNDLHPSSNFADSTVKLNEAV